MDVLQVQEAVAREQWLNIISKEGVSTYET